MMFWLSFEPTDLSESAHTKREMHVRDRERWPTACLPAYLSVCPSTLSGPSSTQPHTYLWPR